MTWPGWIAALRERYLDGRASVFLLHGPGVAEGRWELDGQVLDCLTTLNRFLRRSREILGVADPGLGLSFPDPLDQARFRGLVEAQRVLSGSTNVLREEHPREALAMIWAALSSAAPRPQGYVLLFAEAFSGNLKKPLPALPEGTPPLSRWPEDPLVRGGDKVVVLLAERADGVHPELLSAVGEGLIHVPEAHPEVDVTDEVTEHPELYGVPTAAEPRSVPPGREE